jgi:(p)ppGpp synthase/HD superfamily hydrolase
MQQSLMDRAIQFALLAYGDDKRKGTLIPYITHPYAVGMILAQQGCDEEVIAAGLLHDVVEDTEYTIENIRSQFGDRIADIVQGCSEDKSKTWKERKSHTIETLPTVSPDIQMVTCADKLHNIRSIVNDFRAEG